MNAGSVVLSFYNGAYHHSYVFTGDMNATRAYVYKRHMQYQAIITNMPNWELLLPKKDLELYKKFKATPEEEMSEEFLDRCWEQFKGWLSWNFVVDIFAIVKD